MVSSTQVFYTRAVSDLGIIEIRSFNIEKDISTIYSWVTQPYAKYWGMLSFTKEEVKKSYQDIENNSFHEVFIGFLNKQPIFLFEKYEASHDVIASHYNVIKGDFGMHILVAPPTKTIPNFTWNVFTTVMSYFFSLPEVSRVVVEPDVNNEKIHKLNKKAGFVYQKNIELPNKTASLAFCTKENFIKAIKTSTANDS